MHYNLMDGEIEMGPHVSAIGDVSPVIRGCQAFTIARKCTSTGHEVQKR
jgi:hypothetical protein